MLNGNIEIRLFLPDEGLAQKELERVVKDLELMKRIAFTIKGKTEDIKGERRVYALHRQGKLAGYRIEDVEFIPDRFDPQHFFHYSEGRKEITLEDLDEINRTQEELKQKPYPA
ncbi:MAG: hypothetical protein AABW58_02900 [Nanoarchaeota archaeon]